MSKPLGPRPPPGEPPGPWPPVGGLGGPMMMMGDAPMMGMAPMGMMGMPMGGPMVGPMGMIGAPMGIMGAPMGMMGGPMMGPMAGMHPGMMPGDGFGAPMMRGGGRGRGMMDLGPRPPPRPPPSPPLRRVVPLDEPDIYGGLPGPYGREGFPRSGSGGGRRGDYQRGRRFDDGWERGEDFEGDVLPGRRRVQYRSRGRCGWQQVFEEGFS